MLRPKFGRNCINGLTMERINLPLMRKPLCAFAFIALVSSGLAIDADANDRFEHIESDATNVLETLDARQTTVVLAKVAKWQSSGVAIQQGGAYRVTATGEWQVAPTCPKTGPDGEPLYTVLCWNIGGQLIAGVSHAALIGKIGHRGTPFSIGRQRQFTAHHDGFLYYMVNDASEWFADNTGRVTATIELVEATPQSAQP